MQLRTMRSTRMEKHINREDREEISNQETRMRSLNTKRKSSLLRRLVRLRKQILRKRSHLMK